MVNLKEYLHPHMEILFLALNAPEVSNNNAHWFSRNLSFWNKLFEAGLIIKPVTDPCKGDEIVFGTQEYNYKKWVYGVTDLNRRVVETSSSNVNVEYEDFKRVLAVLDRYWIKKLCIMHSKVTMVFEENGLIERFSGQSLKGYGEVGKYHGVRIFEVPFHNASIQGISTIYSSLLDGEKKKSIVAPEKVTTIPNSNIAVKDLFVGGFVLPSSENSITEKDIKKGVLRITREFWNSFPTSDAEITLRYFVNDEPSGVIVNFKENSPRSHLLRIGQKVISDLNLKARCRVQFKRLGPAEFLIQKL
jgi:hypothetical protein